MSVAAQPLRPSLWAWLLLLVVAGILLSLAVWQYQRGEEKASWLAQHAQQTGSAHMTWSEAELAAETIANRRIQLSGKFLPQYKVALDNQPRSGRAGTEIHVLFQPDASRSAVFVNLGWLPSDRNGGPQLLSSLPENGEISGVVHIPSKFITLGGPELLNGVWRVGRIDSEYWSEAWQKDIKPWVIRLDGDLPGAYLRDWSPTEHQQFGPDRHRAYAFQWFALAVAWCACWYAFWRKGLVGK